MRVSNRQCQTDSSNANPKKRRGSVGVAQDRRRDCRFKRSDQHDPARTRCKPRPVGPHSD